MDKLEVDTSLTESINKKTTATQIMKNITEQYMEEQYTDFHKIYTDASKEHDKIGIGIYDEEINEDISFRLNDRLSITSGELIAINKVTEMLLKLPDNYNKPICICTDSLGSCQAIRGQKERLSRPDIVMDIQKNYSILVSKGIKLKLLWIPSHIGVHGNDKADKSANEGRRKTHVEIDVKLGDSELKSYISTKVNEQIYQREYDDNLNHKIQIYKEMFPQVNMKVNLDGKNILLNRLRTGVTTFERPNTELFCRVCRCSLTINHCLKVCKLFTSEREYVRDRFYQENITFTIKNILHPDRKNSSLKGIMKLIKAIDNVFDI